MAAAGHRGAKQQTILRGDIRRYGLRPDAVALLCQPHRPDDVDRHGAVDPTIELARIADGEIVTAGQHGDPRLRGHGTPQNAVGEGSARMARDDDVGREDLRVLQRAGHESDAPGKSRPGPHQHLVQPGARGRHGRVDRERARRRVVEQQHDLTEQAVSGTQVDDAATAKPPPHPPGHLPRLVQLFARQAASVAHRPGEAMKERFVGEATEVPIGQTAAGGS